MIFNKYLEQAPASVSKEHVYRKNFQVLHAGTLASENSTGVIALGSGKIGLLFPLTY